MDAFVRKQARTYNKTAYILPTYNRTPISLQLHTYKQYLTNFITSKKNAIHTWSYLDAAMHCLLDL